MDTGQIQTRDESGSDTTRRIRSRSWFQVGLIVATAFLLAGLVASQIIHNDKERQLLVVLADNHMRALIAGHWVDVASPDPHTVKSWFDGKINFAPPVPDLSSAGYTLMGGRVEYVGGQVAAALVYQLNKREISVFIWPGPVEGDALQVLPLQRGYQIVGWSDGGLACRAVSEAGAVNLRDFAAAFQSGAKNH